MPTDNEINHVMHQPVPKILKYIEDGYVSFPDDFKNFKNHPKYKEIASRFASMPDPQALQLYASLKAEMESGVVSDELAGRMSSFIAQYAPVDALADKVTDMRRMLGEITGGAEAADWEKVDKESLHSLLMHRKRYPATTHEYEIDKLVWQLSDKSRESDVRRYMTEFPSGVHRVECDSLLEHQDLWLRVKTDPDPVTLSDYIAEEVMSPFRDDAIGLFDILKSMELDKMRSNPGKYNSDTLKIYLDNGIFTKEELIREGVASETSIEMLNNPPGLEPIEQTPYVEVPVQHGATDIFLFGIPSSGKTCVLTGMLGASEFSYDNSTLGGDYADQLKSYRDYGKTPPSTFSQFVAQIVGKIRPSEPGIPMFPINLIEMAGEDFAMNIAYNPEKTTDFESMGTGATQLLTTSNPKVIFIVIDPSASGLIRLATTRADGSTEKRTVQQDMVINKIVNMLEKNPQVLKRTNAIHFIMTKADTIGPREDREDIAVERIKRLYGQAVSTIKELSAKYSINVTTNYAPLLFTFSLGRFYVGDYYEYDPTDADKIVNALKSMVQGEKDAKFFANLKKLIN